MKDIIDIEQVLRLTEKTSKAWTKIFGIGQFSDLLKEIMKSMDKLSLALDKCLEQKQQHH
jgi:hypothetical protein